MKPSLVGPEAAAGPRAARGSSEELPRCAGRPDGQPQAAPDLDRALANEGRCHRRGHHESAWWRRPARRAQRARNSASRDGSVVIAAITSCTNTSNPASRDGSARRPAGEEGGREGAPRQSPVKTSIGPGSLSSPITSKRPACRKELEKVGFYIVGYGCTTCIGNSGPLPAEISQGIAAGDLAVASVLSGTQLRRPRIPRSR